MMAVTMSPFLTLIIAVSVLLQVANVSAGKQRLVVQSDETAILDAPLTFYGTLKHPDKPEYFISWQENWPYERDKMEILNPANNFTSNWTLTYWSKDHYLGEFTMTVVVYYKIFGFYVNVDTQIVHYNITSNFVGKFDVWQSGFQQTADPPLVSTKKDTLLLASFHDPHQYLNTADNLTYSWYNSSSFLANTTSPSLNQTFTREGTYYYNVTLFAVFNSSNINTTVIKNGTLETNITAKVPVVNLTVNGQTWFPHGKLLDLNVTCDGSGPYTYCWRLIDGPYNVTGNETCSMPSVTNDCEFPITRYFQQPGTHTLLVIVSNDVSHVVNQSNIHVYIVRKKQQLSIIVVPVSCSIIAIVIIIFGVAFYLEHQVKYNVEVADFDFGQDADIPYVTFLDRLRTAMTTSGTSHSRLVGSDEASITSP